MSSRPELIGERYELGLVLGRGGMGEVRAATDLRLGREVAVKLLRSDLAEQAGLRVRFEREARAAARISHPNVVAIYDTGEHDNVPFIVMERLPGISLADEVAGGRLGETRACSLVLEVLSALDAAHHLGVIHRDIKPGNILLDPLTHAKVADFGIAKIAEEGDQTTTGMMFGTASYLAPERLAGDPATPATDLYAVGVLLFELLAGHAPFRGDTPLAVVQAISRGVQVPLADVRPDLSPAVVAVVERAMRPDPDARFASASEMIAALAAATRVASAANEPTVRIPANMEIASDDTLLLTAAMTPAAPERVAPASEATDAGISIDAAGEPTVAAPASTSRATRSMRRTAWAIAIATAVVIVAVVLVSAFASNPGPSKGTTSGTPTSAQSTKATIPAPLQHAIDELDQTVTP